MAKLIPTGIPGLDEIVGGGFPRNKLILIAGGPGAGKTIMAGQFLYKGAVEYNEKGVYVSFAETANSFKEAMKQLWMDFDGLEKRGLVKIIDLITTAKPALESNIGEIMRHAEFLGAKRLVIDSFTAMTTAVKGRIEVRILAHLLQKFLLKLDCTTVLITEIPWGKETIGAGVEEFIADGILIIQTYMENGELKRRLIVLKMRGSKTSNRYHELTITDQGVVLTS